jgi:predicted ester cyclase
MSIRRQFPAFVLRLGLIAGLGVGCTPAQDTSQAAASASANAAADQEAANKEVVRRFVAAMNERRFDDLDELVSPDVVRHSPSTPGLEVRSLDQFKDMLRQDFTGVPDAMQDIRFLVAEGDLVGVWANYSGTQDGPIGPFPATGQRVDLDFAGILRLEGGMITEIHVVWDNLSMLVQLGHLEPPMPEGG